MALLTKAQVRTAVMQAIDDPNNKRWSSANLDILIGMVGDMLWSSVLDSYEYATSYDQTVTPAAGGLIDTTGLTKRFYRAQKVLRVSDSKYAQARRPEEAVPQLSYYQSGINIVTDPAVTGASSVTLTYGYLPTNFNALSADGTSLPTEFPEGHELALVYLSAAAALIKGGAEDMGQVGRLADAAVDAFLAHISRRAPTSTQQRAAYVKNMIMSHPLVSGR